MPANALVEQSPICPPRRSLEVSQDYSFFRGRCQHLHLDSPNERIELKLGFTSSSTKPFEISKNAFPYRGYYHYVLWINPRYEKFYTLDRICMILKRAFTNSTRWRVFKNLVANQSMPGIVHYHCLHLKCAKDFRPPCCIDIC